MNQKRSYTTTFKKEVITYYDKHKSTASFQSVSKRFDIPQATFQSFCRRRDIGLKTGDSRKRHRQCFFPEIEQDLVTIVNLTRSTRLLFTGGLLLQKGKMLRSKHKIAPDRFKVGRGWLERFL